VAILDLGGKLNEKGQQERLDEIASQSLSRGVASSNLPGVYRETTTGERTNLTQRAQDVVTSIGANSLYEAAKDTIDTVVDNPNSGKYADGSELSNRNADGSSKSTEASTKSQEDKKKN
jgi:hypothetical protein